VKKTKAFIASFLFIGFVMFSKPNYAGDGALRNPALLFVSAPIITAVIAILITSAFQAPDEPITKISRLPKSKEEALRGFSSSKAFATAHSRFAINEPRSNAFRP
jgi:hypothetical protein